jgi:integrase/ribosomal protein L37E
MQVSEFLNQYTSKSTRTGYRSGLRNYFNFIYEDDSDIEEKAERYLSSKPSLEDDIQKFLRSLKHLQPKTISLYLTAVKMFLIDNEIELPQRFWRKIGRRRQGKRARTLDKVPSNEELRKLISYMDIQGKALYVLLSSSGMRIGAALSIHLDDLDLANNHIILRGEFTKSGEPRHIFFSNETKDLLKDWLGRREHYLETAINRSRHNKTKDDPRLFPFSDDTARHIWVNALKKTGNGQKDKSTNRLRLHPHVLRKFFRTKLGAVIPVDVVEALMGHEEYLTSVYRKYSVEQLKDIYFQGVHILEVLGTSTSDIEIEQLITKVENQEASHKEQMTALISTLGIYQEKITKMETLLNQLTERFKVIMVSDAVDSFGDEGTHMYCPNCSKRYFAEESETCAECGRPLKSMFAISDFDADEIHRQAFEEWKAALNIPEFNAMSYEEYVVWSKQGERGLIEQK